MVVIIAAGSLLALSGTVASSADAPRDSTTTTSTSSTTSTTTTLETTTTTSAPVPTQNPFRVNGVASYLKKRTNLVTAAVYDVRSGETYLYNPGVHERDASMVKIDILATLLYEAQQADRELTAKEKVLATKMVEASNNGAANQLWTDIGGRDALDDFNTLIGFRQTFPNYAWGDIETTPKDQLQLLKVIVLPNAILTPESQEYEMDLMQNVQPFERFGLGWGSPSRVTVGLKDGWFFWADTGWQINTTGYVLYKGRLYLATIMCTENPDETYGEGTVTTIARLIWQNLEP